MLLAGCEEIGVERVILRRLVWGEIRSKLLEIKWLVSTSVRDKEISFRKIDTLNSTNAIILKSTITEEGDEVGKE